MNAKAEEWRDVSWAPVYQVSDLGRVRCKERRVPRKGPTGPWVTKPAKLMKPNLTPHGYHRIQLMVEGKNVNVFVHRLVCEAFNGPPESIVLTQCNHKDSIRTNNVPDNLEWVNNSGNAKHAYQYGRNFSRPKYKVMCVTLGIETLGFERMVKALRGLGYATANSGAIWHCALVSGYAHLGLYFKAEPL